VAVIDPGPVSSDHMRAVASAVERAERVWIVLTHGHADHAGGARSLADEVGAPLWGPESVDGADLRVREGDRVPTDQGELVAVHTPGHTADHHCFHWPDRRALFAGDLLLGQGDTTWVGEYPGCVADYLNSLGRLRALDLDVIYPAHGPPLTDPNDALARYDGHRRARIEQVSAVLEEHPDADVEEVLRAVYGETLPARVGVAARKSLEALIEYVEGRGG
jgi:glyoxylase-like metal-dependent hydrolase (beta-lactamase superfamily II)